MCRVVDVELGVPVGGTWVLPVRRFVSEALSVKCCIASTMVFVRSWLSDVEVWLKRFLTRLRVGGL